MRINAVNAAINRLFVLGGGLPSWSPLSLWPNGIASPGMWMSPLTLDSEWQDHFGTTPVAVPGTVPDTSNPVGLALDIRGVRPVCWGRMLS